MCVCRAWGCVIKDHVWRGVIECVIRSLPDPFRKVGTTNKTTYTKVIRHTRYSFWRQNLSYNTLSCQIPSVSSEELALSRLIRCELSSCCCHGHSLLLSSYLCRTKRKNSSCSACEHPLQDLTHLLLIVPHMSLSGAPSLVLPSFLTSGPDIGAWPNCWVSVEFLHASIPRKRSGSTTTTFPRVRLHNEQTKIKTNNYMHIRSFQQQKRKCATKKMTWHFQNVWKSHQALHRYPRPLVENLGCNPSVEYPVKFSTSSFPERGRMASTNPTYYYTAGHQFW